MSDSNSPYNFGGAESVGKPFQMLGNFMSKLGKGGKRQQAFADTVNLHRQMESVTTEEQGKRLKMLAEHHTGMQKVASESSTALTSEGGMQTSAKYRTPRAPRKTAAKPAAPNKAAVKGTKVSKAPVEGQKAVQTKRPAAKTTVKKVK